MPGGSITSKPEWLAIGAPVLVSTSAAPARFGTVTRHTATRVMVALPYYGGEGVYELPFVLNGKDEWRELGSGTFRSHVLINPDSAAGIRLARGATISKHRHQATDAAQMFLGKPKPTVEDAEVLLKKVQNFIIFMRAIEKDRADEN